MSKRSTEYRTMRKKYKKLIVKNAKTSEPYDFGWMMDNIVLHLQFMRDYYKLGENVFAEEEKDLPSRQEMCEQILSEYEAWDNCDKKYQIYHEKGGIENGKGIVMDGVQQDWWFETLLPNEKENSRAYLKERESHKKQFFTLLAKYVEHLWD